MSASSRAHLFAHLGVAFTAGLDGGDKAFQRHVALAGEAADGVIHLAVGDVQVHVVGQLQLQPLDDQRIQDLALQLVVGRQHLGAVLITLADFPGALGQLVGGDDVFVGDGDHAVEQLGGLSADGQGERQGRGEAQLDESVQGVAPDPVQNGVLSGAAAGLCMGCGTACCNGQPLTIVVHASAIPRHFVGQQRLD